jgi:hypothetical protein
VLACGDLINDFVRPASCMVSHRLVGAPFRHGAAHPPADQGLLARALAVQARGGVGRLLTGTGGVAAARRIGWPVAASRLLQQATCGVELRGRLAWRVASAVGSLLAGGRSPPAGDMRLPAPRAGNSLWRGSSCDDMRSCLLRALVTGRRQPPPRRHAATPPRRHAATPPLRHSATPPLRLRPLRPRVSHAHARQDSPSDRGISIAAHADAGERGMQRRTRSGPRSHRSW